ncbi:MAG: hypothetical protein EA375_06335 [Acholeplasmataceae bacterium]|nr:MAG: hypothetical protein EA375_06335 [Acholeplasmataceae bacterium]
MNDFILRNLGVLLLPFIYALFYFFSPHIHKHAYRYEIGALLLVLLVPVLETLFSAQSVVYDRLIVSGHLSLSLFLLVMFAGVLKKKTVLRKPLDRVRGDMAILAFILLLPHAQSRLDLALRGYNSTGLVAFVLFIPLVLTSFMFIRKRMRPASWKLLHKLSYITYFMIYLHLAFIISLQPGNVYILAARHGLVYHLLLLTYLVLRLINVVIPRLNTPAKA